MCKIFKYQINNIPWVFQSKMDMEQNERIFRGTVFKISFININFHIKKKSWVNKFAYNHATVSAYRLGNTFYLTVQRSPYLGLSLLNLPISVIRAEIELYTPIIYCFLLRCKDNRISFLMSKC